MTQTNPKSLEFLESQQHQQPTQQDCNSQQGHVSSDQIQQYSDIPKYGSPEITQQDSIFAKHRLPLDNDEYDYNKIQCIIHEADNIVQGPRSIVSCGERQILVLNCSTNQILRIHFDHFGNIESSSPVIYEPNSISNHAECVDDLSDEQDEYEHPTFLILCSKPPNSEPNGLVSSATIINECHPENTYIWIASYENKSITKYSIAPPSPMRTITRPSQNKQSKSYKFTSDDGIFNSLTSNRDDSFDDQNTEEMDGRFSPFNKLESASYIVTKESLVGRMRFQLDHMAYTAASEMSLMLIGPHLLALNRDESIMAIGDIKSTRSRVIVLNLSTMVHEVFYQGYEVYAIDFCHSQFLIFAGHDWGVSCCDIRRPQIPSLQHKNPHHPNLNSMVEICGQPGKPGHNDGPPETARFWQIRSMIMDRDHHHLFLAEHFMGSIRVFNILTRFTTTLITDEEKLTGISGLAWFEEGVLAACSIDHNSIHLINTRSKEAPLGYDELRIGRLESLCNHRLWTIV